MAERWTEIKQIDDDICANRRGKQRAQDEIKALQNKLANYDHEYDELRSHKKFLGKELYGNPITRRKLIENGLGSGNSRVRAAAQSLQERDSYINGIRMYKKSLSIYAYILMPESQKSTIGI